VTSLAVKLVQLSIRHVGVVFLGIFFLAPWTLFKHNVLYEPTLCPCNLLGLLPLTGLVICGLLARLIVTHRALTDLVPARLIPQLLRLTKQFFNRLVLCLFEKPRRMITLTNPGLPAWLPKEGEALPSTKSLIEYTLTCWDSCCLPVVLASLAYLCDLFSKPKPDFLVSTQEASSISKAF